jgi:predicted RNase H-like HicB family nuclease
LRDHAESDSITLMAALDYKVFLEPDEDGGYVVVCPSFQGCYSQGETVEEALFNIREAIELCLEEKVHATVDLSRLRSKR